MAGGRRTIRNRDIIMLQDLRAIEDEIGLLNERIKRMRAAMTNTAQRWNTGAGGRGGRPHGYEEGFAELSELESRLDNRLKCYLREDKRMEKILSRIQDGTMRSFVQMMYVDNLSAAEIRAKLNMGRKLFEQAREAVEQATCMAEVQWSGRLTTKEADE